MQLPAEVERALAAYRTALEEAFDERLLEVLLFGAHACDDVYVESEVEVLVTIDDLTNADRNRAFDLAYEVQRGGDWVGLAPLVCSLAQAASLRTRDRRLAGDGLPEIDTEQKRRSVAAEVARAEESRRAAGMLLAAGLAADAVSRAYYAASHYARAVLVTASEQPRTRRGIARVLQRELVEPGKINADAAKLFMRLQRYRQDVDDAPYYVVSSSGAAEEITAADTFIVEARRFLVDAGLLKP